MQPDAVQNKQHIIRYHRSRNMDNTFGKPHNLYDLYYLLRLRNFILIPLLVTNEVLNLSVNKLSKLVSSWILPEKSTLNVVQLDEQS